MKVQQNRQKQVPIKYYLTLQTQYTNVVGGIYM